MHSRCSCALSRRFVPILPHNFAGGLTTSTISAFYLLSRSKSNVAQGSGRSTPRGLRLQSQSRRDGRSVRQGSQAPKHGRIHGVHASRQGTRSSTHNETQKHAHVTDLGSRNLVATRVKGNRFDPYTWMRMLEPFLPVALRFSVRETPYDSENVEQDGEEIVRIIKLARRHVGGEFDLLQHMIVRYGRDQAALYLINKMLSCVRSLNLGADQLPSNIKWPSELLQCRSLPTLDRPNLSATAMRQSSLLERFQNHAPPGTKLHTTIMRQVWLSLGNMVVAAAKPGTPEPRLILSLVQRVLAKLHHNGLIPDAIYEYRLSPYSLTVNRPPMLHLLSSRILTALSDAAWRSQQDENIARVAADGGSTHKIYRDPPGGRFRLRVRDLGPEVWLEFILWCCAEGRYPSTGAKIVDVLRKQAEAPWFAVNWSSNDLGHSVPLVDWDKAYSRTGGTVGRIEGYSGEEPLATIPKQTISAEVVLALVEGVLNIADFGYPITPKAFDHISKHVKSLVSFLEPHSLPAEYFDYLTVRLLQSDKMDYDKDTFSLGTWSKVMDELRELERVTPTKVAKPILKYNDIVSQSLTRAGVMHQSLMAFIRGGFVFQSVDHFSTIQYHVDRSKVQSILAFVQTSRQDDNGFFDSRPSNALEEYADSHGEPSPHVLAAFLQHMTENKELEVAKWMVYSEDVDGPIIPSWAFRHMSIALAVTQLAGETGDAGLLERTAQAGRTSNFKPAVKLLRSIADAHIRHLDFHRAALAFEQLRDAIAGGYSPNNLANLAATILRLEARCMEMPEESIQHHVRQARSLLRMMLGGHYDATKGDFYRSQLSLFRQQIGHLVRILKTLPQSRLSGIADAYFPFYSVGNAANLEPRTFNILLSGIVDAYGASEGSRIWQVFCKDPRARSQNYPDREGLEMFLADAAADELESFEEHYHEPSTELKSIDYGSGLHSVYDAKILDWSSPSMPGESLTTEGPSASDPLSDLTITADFESFDMHNKQPQFDIAKGRDGPALQHHEETIPKPLSKVRDNHFDSNPCVIPNIQTIRIITKRALVEQNPASTRHLLAWAASYMQSIDRPEAEVELETTMPTHSEQQSSTTTQDTSRDDDMQTIPEEPPVRLRKHFVDAGTEADFGHRQRLWQNLLRRNKNQTA